MNDITLSLSEDFIRNDNDFPIRSAILDRLDFMNPAALYNIRVVDDYIDIYCDGGDDIHEVAGRYYFGAGMPQWVDSYENYRNGIGSVPFPVAIKLTKRHGGLIYLSQPASTFNIFYSSEVTRG